VIIRRYWYDKRMKEEVEKLHGAILDIIISGLENGAITEVDVPIISRFVLDGTETAVTQEELMTFLKLLAEKWGMFEVLKVSALADVKKKTDAQAAAHALTLLQAGNIDGALAMVKSATDSDNSEKKAKP